MRQIRKQIGYPELQTYNIHHNLLEPNIKAIRNSVTLSIKFLKVKAHTGIIGNERVDQIAKHAAKIMIINPSLTNPICATSSTKATHYEHTCTRSTN